MKTLLAALLVFAVPGPSCLAQNLSKADESFVDSIMSAHYKPDEPGAVVLLAKNGVPVFRKAYGLANLELNVPNRPEYLFRIGSMSKQFTAVCVLQLAQAGKLSLRDDIRRYLPDYDTHGRTITIENLLSHTSGVPSYTEKPDFMKKITIDQSKEEMVNYFMEDSLLFEPGTDWSYSNSGYVLAGLVVEKVSGKSLEEYLRTNIFAPLGMTRTHIGTHERVIPGTVTGYEAAGDSTFMDAPYLSWSWPYAAGGIISCVDDLLKWDEALYGESILKQDWLKKAWTSFLLSDGQKANYGFGWAVNEYRGLSLITHGGGINGFLSDAIRIPTRHLYVVILSNKAVKSPGEFSGVIALRVAGAPLAEPVTTSPGMQKLQEYTGSYEVRRAGGRRTTNSGKETIYRYLTVSKDTLFTQRTGGGRVALLNIGDDLFVQKDSRTYFRFSRNNGTITALEIYNEPVHYGPTEIEPRTNVPIPAEKTSITLNPKTLEQYRGKYDFGGGFFLTVTTDGNRIFSQATGQEVVEMFPETETKFFLKVVDASIEFVRDGRGRITGLTLTQGGRFEAKKIE